MGASRRGALARGRAPERRPAASVVACVAMQDPTFASLVELSAALESRRLSPVDLVEALLARIARRDPALHAFVAVYADEARLAAEGAERAFRSGHRIGPLHGIPVALKDLVELEGRVTTGGSKAWPAASRR